MFFFWHINNRLKNRFLSESSNKLKNHNEKRLFYNLNFSFKLLLVLVSWFNLV